MRRVLVVDDSPATRQMMRRILALSGWDVAEADTAEDALTALSAGAVDVLLTDVFLPRQDGVWLIAQARTHHLANRMVAISGGGTIDGRDVFDAALAAGADLTLQKPLDVKRLLAAVATEDA